MKTNDLLLLLVLGVAAYYLLPQLKQIAQYNAAGQPFGPLF